MKHSLPLNKEWIDSQALKIVKKLQSHNHTTYLVGGCVRDLLIGLPPKDFDISTSATPEQVRRVIRPSHIIGRRFQLVLVKRFGEQYEISTFRGQAENQGDGEGPIWDDNTFGTPEEDARRRDFTINSFFYDPVKRELLDYCQGLQDIKDRVVRMIGDPATRIQEDPLRMLRALRFAHKSNFSIEENLREAIFQGAHQLQLTVLPRRREELLKFLRLETASNLLWECQDLNLLKYLSPALDDLFSHHDGDLFNRSLNQGLQALWDRSSPNELFSILLFSMISAKDSRFCETLSLQKSQIMALEEWARNEWGMFRNELDFFFQTLHFIKTLQKMRRVDQIRERYRRHLLKNDLMMPALVFSQAYKLLPEREIHFWAQQFGDYHAG